MLNACRIASICFFTLLSSYSISSKTMANSTICDDKVVTVALDIGHSISSGGATSARGIQEFVYNQKLAQRVRSSPYLSSRVKLILINEKGDIASLQERTRIANENNANYFLSLHHDSVQEKYLSTWQYQGQTQTHSDDFSGFSLFINENASKALSSILFASNIADILINDGYRPTLHHAEKIKGENRKLLDEKHGIYSYPELYVLRTAQMPAVLLEAAVIVNRDDEDKIISVPSYHQGIADAIALTISNLCPK